MGAAAFSSRDSSSKTAFSGPDSSPVLLEAISASGSLARGGGLGVVPGAQPVRQDQRGAGRVLAGKLDGERAPLLEQGGVGRRRQARFGRADHAGRGDAAQG